jgi:exopolysaccharide production protein ExoZ
VERLQSLQVLRFVAAAAVIVCHAYEPAKIGAFGVDIFFVISGFIISRVMVGKSPAQFLIARLVRIYPIYWVCAVPSASVAFFIGAATLPRTLTSLTLWPVFDGFLQPYLVLGWTLSFEMLFYLCATLVLVDRRFLWLLVLAYPSAMLGAFLTDAPLLRFIGNPLILEFMLGVFIGHFSVPTTSARTGLGAALVAVAILIVTISDAHHLSLPRNTFELAAPERALVWGVPAGMIVWGALQWEKSLSKSRLLGYLGNASYSIYLSHGTSKMLTAVSPWPVQVIGAIIVGAVVYRYLEVPLLRRLRSSLSPRALPTFLSQPSRTTAS